jgi:hypothetical protein
MNFGFHYRSFYKSQKGFFGKFNNKFQGNLLNSNVNSNNIKGLFTTYSFLNKMVFISTCSGIMSTLKFKHALPVSSERSDVDFTTLVLDKLSLISPGGCSYLLDLLKSLQGNLNLNNIVHELARTGISQGITSWTEITTEEIDKNQ